MTGKSKAEYVKEIRWRYARAGRPYKKILLDQLCDMWGCMSG